MKVDGDIVAVYSEHVVGIRCAFVLTQETGRVPLCLVLTEQRGCRDWAISTRGNRGVLFTIPQPPKACANLGLP